MRFVGSPFRVQVRDRLDAGRVNVKMSPTMRANVLQEILIDGQTAGPGTPSVEITDIHGKQVCLRIRSKTNHLTRLSIKRNPLTFSLLFSYLKDVVNQPVFVHEEKVSTLQNSRHKSKEHIVLILIGVINQFVKG